MQIRGMSVLVACLALNLAATGLAQNGRGGGKPKDPPGPADPVILTGGGGTLRVMNADGSGETLIQEVAPWAFESPSWSPGGDWIVFTGTPADSPSSGLFVIRKDGSGRELLIADSSIPSYFITSAKWSPDSQWIAFTELIDDCNVDLRDSGGCVPDIAYGAVSVMSVTPNPAGPESLPTFGTPIRLWATQPGVSFPSELDWSPDSDRLAVTESTQGSWTYDVVILDVDYECGTEAACAAPPTPLRNVWNNELVPAPDLPANLRYPSWSKSHDWITAFDADTRRLVVVDAGGQCQPQPLPTSFSWSEWSPDDAQIVFSLNDSTPNSGRNAYSATLSMGGECVIGAQAPTVLINGRHSKVYWPDANIDWRP